MSISVSTAFIKQFESDVHMAYQRMGSKLKDTIRQKPNVNGNQTVFQKVGKGSAVQKSRHGQVPIMNIDHTNVTATLSDYFSADYVDRLDELKTNIDERMVVAQSAAGALGRKTDELITTALDGTSNLSGNSDSDGLTQAKIEAVFAQMGENDVIDDGDRYFIVSPDGWVDLLQIWHLQMLTLLDQMNFHLKVEWLQKDGSVLWMIHIVVYQQQVVDDNALHITELVLV